MKVPWRRVVHNNHEKLKWIFILILTIHRKLYTEDRLEKWGLITDTTCSLCNSEPESHQHLFFECTESRKIWHKLLGWINITRGRKGWLEEVDWIIIHASGKSARVEIYRIAMAGRVYLVWQETNNIIFKKTKAQHRGNY